MRSGRPNKPSYKSIRRVLDAIRDCSCGKVERRYRSFKNQPRPASYLLEIGDCECVGPKLWSQLLSLTRLHRNTLSATCKFLVEKEVLDREVLKKRGHYVQYSIRNSYREKLQEEIEYSGLELRRLYKNKFKPLQVVQFVLNGSEKFERHYRGSIDWLKRTGFDPKHLPTPFGRYLVILVDRLGLKAGLHKFNTQHKQLGFSAFRAHASLAVYGQKKLKRFRTLLR